MFKSMCANGGVINFATEIATEVDYKLVLTLEKGTEMSALLDNGPTGSVFIPPKHLVYLGVGCNVPPDHSHDSQVLACYDFLPIY